MVDVTLGRSCSHASAMLAGRDDRLAPGTAAVGIARVEISAEFRANEQPLAAARMAADMGRSLRESQFRVEKRCVNPAPVVFVAHTSLTCTHEIAGGRLMSEIEKLTTLREKLVVRRRSLVESFQKAAPEGLTGDSITRIQSAIEAVDRAIEDEMSTHDARRRAVPVS
jgi:hypothetical protein